MHILVVEDEVALCDTIVRSLKRLAYSVDYCYDGQKALDMLSVESFDLVVLDLNLPYVDGMTVLKTLRQTDIDTKVLILSARCEVADKVLGLDEGANDYLTKPFSYNELNSRVKALLRRYHIYQGKDHSIKQESVLNIGKLKLDTNLKTAFKDGKEILLTDIEYQILLFFAQHKNTVYSLAEIYENIWQEKYLPSSSNTVMVHVLRLRQKIEENPAQPEIIRTIYGKGYQVD